MYTSNKYIIGIAIVSAISVVGCIENDLPYPHIQPNFTTIETQNLLSAPVIDSIGRNVTLYFDEAADIENVVFDSYSISPADSRVVSPDLSGTFNLTEPLNVTLALYQEYEWTITAVQNIERYFNVSSQIGASVIDAEAHTVKAYVPEGSDMSHIQVQNIKLGGSLSTMIPDLNGAIVDFSAPVTVDVESFGRTATWTITVEQSDVSVSIEQVDAWTNVAWVYAAAESGKNNRFEYRIASGSEWTEVPTAWTTIDGGSFSARIIHLQANTTYQVRALSDDEFSAEVIFTTGSDIQMPNSSFDSWWQDGKVWCPWAEDATPWIDGGTLFWGTGNRGATTLGQSNSTPTTDTPTGEGLAAQLESKFVGVSIMGKLAAGNIFTGDYVRTDGTNGILGFGREFTERPTKLRGYLKYNCAPISNVSSDFDKNTWIGQPDTAVVYVALTDWAEQYQIRTNPNNRQLFNKNSQNVIAYGCVEYGETIENYIPFEINIEYRDTHRVPTYILVVATASKYGDYFTGGNGSVLCVDDFKLEYDY